MLAVEEPDSPDAPAAIGHLFAFARTQMLAAFVDLGIDGVLGSGPADLDTLAARTRTHRASLERLLRGLVATEVVDLGDDGQYRLGPVGSLLDRTGLGAFATYLAQETYAAWAGLTWSIQTGQAAFPEQHGSPYFDWVGADADRTARFDRAMAATVASRIEPLLRHPWSPDEHVVDVGGGRGEMLGRLLAAVPGLRGTLVDTPDVAAQATEHLAAQGLDDRGRALAGDFFVEVPAGADTYLLAQVLHDWDDDDAARILATCARALGPSGRVLLLEAVLDDVPVAGDDDWMLDLNMLVLLGGRERTLADWRALAAGSGLAITATTPGRRASVLELRRGGDA